MPNIATGGDKHDHFSGCRQLNQALSEKSEEQRLLVLFSFLLWFPLYEKIQMFVWCYLHGHDAQAHKFIAGTAAQAHQPQQNQTQPKEQHDFNPQPKLQHSQSVSQRGVVQSSGPAHLTELQSLVRNPCTWHRSHSMFKRSTCTASFTAQSGCAVITGNTVHAGVKDGRCSRLRQ